MAPLQAQTPLSCPHIGAMAALDQLHSVAAEWWTAGRGLIGVVDVGRKPRGRLPFQLAAWRAAASLRAVLVQS